MFSSNFLKRKINNVFLGTFAQIRNQSKYFLYYCFNRLNSGSCTSQMACSWQRDTLVIYINLAYRKDRNQKILGEFKNLKIKTPLRFEAVADQDGALGCSKSHLEVLKIAKDRNTEFLMVCEDDVKFCISRRKLAEIINEFKENLEYDALCLGFNVEGQVYKKSKNFSQTYNSSTTSCYVLKSYMIPELIRIAEQSVENLSKSPSLSIYQIDQMWKILQAQRNFVITNQRYVYQRNSYSDILKTKARYGV
jgi:glycosyl transferase family 25